MTVAKKAVVAFLTTLCVLLLTPLAACGGNGGSPSGASGSASGVASAPAAGLISVGFSQVSVESDWRIANTASIKEALCEANGYQLIFKDAQQKLENQLEAVREFIAAAVDYIVIAPITETGWDEVLQEAQAADIPVILVGRMIDVSDDSLYTCWVGSDFFAEGSKAAKWMEQSLGSGPLNIVHIQGTLGSSAQIGRSAGLEEGLARNSNWQLVAQGTGDFSETNGRDFMERTLRQNLNINLIYCENDNMAFGAMEALDAARIPYGRSSDITLVSFDGTRRGLENTLAGRINLDVECNPLHGPRVAEIIQQMEKGLTPIKRSFMTEAAFEAATITQAQIDGRDY
ncbi:MAG: ABC transporter substrate-binding protein [Coriobacteriales bacterium]|nr:ABC transporter substrate-binding protein [Coriobacteriales bacterium]